MNPKTEIQATENTEATEKTYFISVASVFSVSNRFSPK